MRSLSDTPHSWYKELYDRTLLALGILAFLYTHPIIYLTYPEAVKLLFGTKGWIFSLLLYTVTLAMIFFVVWWFL